MNDKLSQVRASRSPTCARLTLLVLGIALPVVLVWQPVHAASAPTHAAEFGKIYDSLHGEVMLDNARYQVEKFELAPGASTGRHSHPADQLLVIIKGGTLKSVDSDRSTLWKDGRVMWYSASAPADGGSTNVGTTPMVMLWVTIKPEPPGIAAQDYPNGTPKDYHLNYPNVPGEDLFENERVVVQRLTVMPGQWEGPHAHIRNQLYIEINGGYFTGRTYKKPEFDEGHGLPGAAGFMPTFDASVGHESQNSGKEPIEMVWVTLKD
jgi:quercetin dioxygenase-like cupin family protein